jgi:hypothetical protein
LNRPVICAYGVTQSMFGTPFSSGRVPSSVARISASAWSSKKLSWMHE